ncbi:hypothetical protein K458DRAFT_437181 [Lentithecium fluviatile CBS 122367]|uniref:Uncharacterized protein n=1 Tax=Lentithecium fluviatile CBS 122367 TaxID=1168545 RepID=A0A6G1IE77_9PLEO|nr:hypothetical protein K458DRAFT_437181 [Lentithecium fluviatile CBS 122367]
MASSSSSSFIGQALTNSRDHHFDWSIVVLKNGVHTVYNVELHSGMTGTTAMHAIRKAYKGTKPTILWFHARSLLKDAVISSFTASPDPEAQDYPRSVIIASNRPLIELTKAFHDPSLLAGSGAALIRENPQFNPKNPTDGHYHAILIKTEASRWLFVVGMASTILVASVIGYVVGHFTRTAILGVVAGATTVSVFAFIQASIGCSFKE